MANPKPVYTLTRWKVLSNEEASELIDDEEIAKHFRQLLGTENEQ